MPKFISQKAQAMYPIYYRKLVRDKINDIILSSGKEPVVRQLDDAEYLYFLKLKLLEEAHELFNCTETKDFIKEAADVTEIIKAMAELQNVTLEEIETTRSSRARERGAFNSKDYLHAVYKDEKSKVDEQDGYLLVPSVVSNKTSPSLLELIIQELNESAECSIATAFLTRGMLNLLKQPIERFLAKGGKLKILTSIMNCFNDPDDLKHIESLFPDIELRIFYPETDGKAFNRPPPAFHIKCFLFTKSDGHNSLVIGSSNMTGGGLQNNEEWNYFSNSEVNLPFAKNEFKTIFEQVRDKYNSYWTIDSIELSDQFFSYYNNIFDKRSKIRTMELELEAELETPELPEPRPAQKEALAQLAQRRESGITKAAVIAATGLGKTHLAAFDFAQSGMQNCLFIVHRANILTAAMETFRQVLQRPSFGKLLSGETPGNERTLIEQSDCSVFAMIQTLSRPETLEKFAANRFDYIIFDEFHHSAANSYKTVLQHFDGKFLLGLTATPERMDGRDVLEICDYEVAYESRLFDAIDQGWLTPFQYYAIYDQTDYNRIRWTGTGYDDKQLEKALATDTRAQLITKNLKSFLPSAGKIKALAFCSNKGHARFMSKVFSEAGLPSVYLIDESTNNERVDAINRLQNESDELNVICSVDILGEGADIPAVSHVLMLRPTESYSIVLQQIGRGLRKVTGKEFLVVLDFIGNYHTSYITPLIFNRQYAPDQHQALKSSMKFKLPAGCHVDADKKVIKIWQNQIRKTFAPRSRSELLLNEYNRLKNLLGKPPTLLDFLANPEAADPQAFIKHFGSWLAVKEQADDLSKYESYILSTSGSAFLTHLEKELKPSKSYKMVVLKTLLSDTLERTQWPAEWIAEGFKTYYLQNQDHTKDCTPLAKAKTPKNVSLTTIVRLLKNMPLHYLSNKESDFFTFDKNNNLFSIKEDKSDTDNTSVKALWNEKDFQSLVKDRVDYALAAYFYRRKHHSANADSPPQTQTLELIEVARPDSNEFVELPYYPELKLAAGAFEQGTPETTSKKVKVVANHKIKPDNGHFIAKISGDSMDGGKNPICNGDLVVLEPITPTRGGSVRGQIIAVKYTDEYGDTTYALKRIIKAAPGEYYLASKNKSYPNVKINPDHITPFARFITKATSFET